MAASRSEANDRSIKLLGFLVSYRPLASDFGRQARAGAVRRAIAARGIDFASAQRILIAQREQNRYCSTAHSVSKHSLTSHSPARQPQPCPTARRHALAATAKPGAAVNARQRRVRPQHARDPVGRQRPVRAPPPPAPGHAGGGRGTVGAGEEGPHDPVPQDGFTDHGGDRAGLHYGVHVHGARYWVASRRQTRCGNQSVGQLLRRWRGASEI